MSLVKIFPERIIFSTYPAAVTEVQSQLFYWLIWASLGAAVLGLTAGLLVRLRIQRLDSKNAEQDEP